LNKIWKFLYILALALVPLIAIIAGFMFLTAGGEPEKIRKARNLLLWMAVGVVIILLAGGIVKVIKMILGVEN
jgi:preprotein translocase subunit YajC